MIPIIYYNKKQFHIKFRFHDNYEVRCHICNENGEHIHGYCLFSITYNGCVLHPSIGEENHGIDRYMDLVYDGLRLRIVGIDEI
jgi:hypothetical protein